jgi:tetratricopeptide (TPR) repeat protein
MFLLLSCGVDDPLPPPAPPSHRTVAALGLALVAWVFAIYSGVWEADFIALDDSNHVYLNAIVQGGLTRDGVLAAFAEPHAYLWVPLTLVSLMADVSLFGMNPVAMHLENIAWHAGAAMLLLLALHRATGRLGPSAAVAALFALHPINVESVAWITERKNVLCAFFTMATLWWWCGWVRDGGRWRYGAALGAFALALMAKPMAVPLPAALLLLDVWPLQRTERARWRRLVWEKAPFALFALAASDAALWAAASATHRHLPFDVRLSNALVSSAAYLRQLVWPADFAIPYPHPGVAQWPMALAAAAMLAVLTALAWQQRKERPWLLVGWLFFLGMLLPSSGLVQVGAQARADRFTYLAQVGLFIAIVWTLATLPAGRWRVPLSLAAGGVLSALTHAQACLWSDGVTLFRHALAITGPNPLVYEYLATAHELRREPDKAATLLLASVQRWPEDARAWRQLGRVLVEMDRAAAAREAFQNAAAIEPGHVETHIQLALLFESAGDPATSERHARQAATLAPGRVLPGILQARLAPPPPRAD